MYQNYRPNQESLPPAVKNLLILNIMLFAMTYLGKHFGQIYLTEHLGLYFFKSNNFMPWQIITHMFMHSDSDIWHIGLNMFMLYMFGRVLENLWGSKRFLFYYFVTAIGAAAIHTLVNYIDYIELRKHINPEDLKRLLSEGRDLLLTGRNYTDPYLSDMNFLVNTPTVGASGAVYGILLAFGMLFPNTELYLYFAIPVKAKYLVIFMILLELFLGFRNSPSDNIAHFAHLGGMLFGFFLIRYWNHNNRKTLF